MIKEIFIGEGINKRNSFVLAKSHKKDGMLNSIVVHVNSLKFRVLILDIPGELLNLCMAEAFEFCLSLNHLWYITWYNLRIKNLSILNYEIN
jgi:hypothetical protein